MVRERLALKTPSNRKRSALKYKERNEILPKHVSRLLFEDKDYLGYRLFKCPHNCGQSFANESQLFTHMHISHSLYF